MGLRSSRLVARLGRIQLPVIRNPHGPLTEELVQQPGKFGLGNVPSGLKPDATTTAVCGYCATGCGLNIHLRNGEAINLTPTTEYPVNLGMACPKGWEALRVLDSDDRARIPLLRDASSNQMPVSWEMAMHEFCSRFKSIMCEWGNESVAFLSTGQIVTEEMLLLGCLAKFGMGFVHGDSNTRQCMATAATAYKQSFGFDSPPYTYADFEASDVLMFVGSNPCIAHPIMWQRVLRNPNSPQIIVVDPRRTETAMSATEHLAIQPKSDLTLLYAIARQLIKRGYVDRAYVDQHSNGFEQFVEHVSAFSPERMVEESGITISQFERVVETIGAGKRVSFWWTMGVNQSYQGTRTAQAIINLALMTGNIGRPGTGANSITGQCNAMGSRLYSNLTSLPAGRDPKKAADRDLTAERLEIPVDRISERESFAYDQILQGIQDGKIRGLWVIATNTAHSWIDSSRARELLDKLDFLVVQDMYHTTETARLADLVLPAAGWGEKEGTLINSERRIGLAKRVRHAPGQALADFSIFRLIAEHWGCGEMFREWTSPATVFEKMKYVSQGQPCDISGITDYAMIDRLGGIQWPWPKASESEACDPVDPVQERRLFTDGLFFHEDQRAKFLFAEPESFPEPPSSRYPFILLTGRGTVSQWHTQSRTSKSSVLRSLYPQRAYVELNPLDAVRLKINAGDEVLVTSLRGEAKVVALISAAVQPNQLFMPMHDAQTNQLTREHVDPYSRQPAYKNCAVNLQPVRST